MLAQKLTNRYTCYIEKNILILKLLSFGDEEFGVYSGTQKEYQLPVILISRSLVTVIDKSSLDLNFLAHHGPVLDHPQEVAGTCQRCPWQRSLPQKALVPHTEKQHTGQDDWVVINTEPLKAEIINGAEEQGENSPKQRSACLLSMCLLVDD